MEAVDDPLLGGRHMIEKIAMLSALMHSVFSQSCAGRRRVVRDMGR
jgi:hypothetical protein